MDPLFCVDKQALSDRHIMHLTSAQIQGPPLCFLVSQVVVRLSDCCKYLTICSQLLISDLNLSITSVLLQLSRCCCYVLLTPTQPRTQSLTRVHPTLLYLTRILARSSVVFTCRRRSDQNHPRVLLSRDNKHVHR